jgi:hypothetical protein
MIERVHVKSTNKVEMKKEEGTMKYFKELAAKAGIPSQTLIICI